ncbi:hypothetical protein AR457_16975 [Streptomyces agglomeratus]|uniref:hypothetical protein n=1 Tax=Streptomyces agglomeratus TaxID=285458 RepID=UPI000854541A|nr:hypothetical protein [Streptomyces agglomeratus]OEJ40045.1 hypothetical protein BGK70_19675 [Streptomyces agglomeratus]OEJ45575.1 hypothetical protein AR457_16975 [Streptomyces agglomeratus]
MSTGAVVLLGVVAAIITALLLARPVAQAAPGDLRRRFGPEFDETAARHGGDAGAAEHELGERLRRYGGLRVKSLSLEAREQYAAQWAGLQEQFVDAPGPAVARANQLLSSLARDRGFPAESVQRQYEALSVHCPHEAGARRLLHEAAERAAAGDTDTEAMRRALIAGRALFAELVRTRPHDEGARVIRALRLTRRPRLPAQRVAAHTRAD